MDSFISCGTITNERRKRQRNPHLSLSRPQELSYLGGRVPSELTGQESIKQYGGSKPARGRWAAPPGYGGTGSRGERRSMYKHRKNSKAKKRYMNVLVRCKKIQVKKNIHPPPVHRYYRPKQKVI